MNTVSAGQWELRRRLVLLIVLLALIAIIVLGATRVVDGAWLAVAVGVIVVIAAVILWRIGRHQSDAVAQEKSGGYSTLYDFTGFELRDYRTQAVLRPRDVAPDGGTRRSLISGMLTVTAGSALGRRWADEPGRPDQDGKPDPTPR